ncbi:MAG TPA: phosphoribosyltransferase [Capsulimonadaceae bacterium]|nr:phosphoribosyltransferase [Capsulimonadaceae bacterium]
MSANDDSCEQPVSEMVFKDRADAGRKLAERLRPFADQNPIVLGLPRGGVAVAHEIARALPAPLDLIVARKLGAPGQPELGIGAVAPGGVMVVDRAATELLGITSDILQEIAARELAEVDRRLLLYRGDRPPPDLADRTVILVDDGLATGVTARAAIQALRRHNPRRLVLAVPVCAPETQERLGPEVDDMVCLLVPENFRAVGIWYEDFEQLTDEQVVQLLQGEG